MPIEYFNSEHMKDILWKKRIRTLDMYGSLLMSVIEYNDHRNPTQRFWVQDAGSILTLMPLYYNCRLIDFTMVFGSAITGTTLPTVKLVCFDNINPAKSIAKIELGEIGIAEDIKNYYERINKVIYDEFELAYNRLHIDIWNEIKNHNKFYLGLEIKTAASDDINNGFYTACYIQTIHGAPSEMPLTSRSIAPTDMSGN